MTNELLIEKHEVFVDRSIRLIDDLTDLIERMPYKGDKCECSQKMCLLITLLQFENNVNGTRPEDFEPGEQYAGHD
jgi:hypothetical protein